MQRWWLFTLRGVFAVLFGLLALIWPGLTLIALILLWGAYALVDGAMTLYATLTHPEWPARWALATGVLQIVNAIRLRKVMTNEWFYIVTGALTALLGVILIVNPAAGALAFVITIGVFAILWGVVLVLFSLRLRQRADVTAPRA